MFWLCLKTLRDVINERLFTSRNLILYRVNNNINFCTQLPFSFYVNNMKNIQSQNMDVVFVIPQLSISLLVLIKSRNVTDYFLKLKFF